MFDGFSYSSSEINYWMESCIVSGLMTRVAYKSSGRLTPFQDGGNETDECKKKKKHINRKMFFFLLLHFFNNLEVPQGLQKQDGVL